MEEKNFLGGSLVANNSIDFCIICDIPVFPLSLYSDLPARIWSEVETALLPVIALIGLQIPHSKMVYLSYSDVTGLCSPSLDFFTGNELIAPDLFQTKTNLFSTRALI